LHLVTCAEPEASVSGGVGSDSFRTDWRHDAEEFLKALARELQHESITWNVSTGDPAGAIVDEATRLGAGTIVVGNVRTHGLSRVLGSVATSVVHKAPCDVLVAHTT
jgi:nucleotide-binding universal stress UspA family protein